MRRSTSYIVDRFRCRSTQEGVRCLSYKFENFELSDGLSSLGLRVPSAVRMCLGASKIRLCSFTALNAVDFLSKWKLGPYVIYPFPGPASEPMSEPAGSQITEISFSSPFIFAASLLMNCSLSRYMSLMKASSTCPPSKLVHSVRRS